MRSFLVLLIFSQFTAQAALIDLDFSKLDCPEAANEFLLKRGEAKKYVKNIPHTNELARIAASGFFTYGGDIVSLSYSQLSGDQAVGVTLFLPHRTDWLPDNEVFVGMPIEEFKKIYPHKLILTVVGKNGQAAGLGNMAPARLDLRRKTLTTPNFVCRF